MPVSISNCRPVNIKGIGMIWILGRHVPVDRVLVGLDASAVCISQRHHAAKTIKVIVVDGVAVS